MPRITLKTSFYGEQGSFLMDVGEWQGDHIQFHFEDKLLGNSGVIDLDAKEGSVQISFHSHPKNSLIPAEKRQDYMATLVNGFIQNYRFGWSPKKPVVSYDKSYHENLGYDARSKTEEEIKSVQALIIRRLASPRKVLVAGCSSGALVEECRKEGMETYGFDVFPEIKEKAFPAVKDFLRFGSLTQIPFQSADNFDTLVAVDVLEHIPEKDLSQFVSELDRLRFQKLIFVINLNDCSFPGHVTLRPITWWSELLRNNYSLSRVERKFENFPSVYSNDGDYNRQWMLLEKKL